MVATDSRQRLIEAAEHLFATRGIDAVSLAEITLEAGLNNTGAVHYYFGGREELLEAIVEQHRTELDRRREELFDAAEARGPVDLEAVLRASIEPLVDQLDDPRGRAFLSIQAQRHLRPRRPPAQSRPVAARMMRALGASGARDPVAKLVGDFGLLLTFGALAQRARTEGGGRAAVPRQVFVDELVAAVVRVHTVPARGRRRRTRASAKARA
jgi:AcrR family transcriptional regulator